MVFRRCRRILGNEEDAKDAVQEVFLKVLGRRPQYRGTASPSTWLYGAATLHCLQKLRNRRRRDEKQDELAKSALQLEPAPDYDRLALRRLLDVESDELRLITYCRYVDEMSLEEIAEVVGRSRKTVSHRLQSFVEQARLELDGGRAP